MWRPECPECFSGNQPQGRLSCLALLLGDQQTWRRCPGCPARKPAAPRLPAGWLLGGSGPRHGAQPPPLLPRTSPLRGPCGQFPQPSRTGQSAWFNPRPPRPRGHRAPLRGRARHRIARLARNFICCTVLCGGRARPRACWLPWLLGAGVLPGWGLGHLPFPGGLAWVGDGVWAGLRERRPKWRQEEWGGGGRC